MIKITDADPIKLLFSQKWTGNALFSKHFKFIALIKNILR